MMHWKNGALVLSLAALACSGRYEVGAMDAAGGTAAGSPGVGGSSPVEGGSQNNPTGGNSNGCTAAGAPAVLTGTFVAPNLAWSRVSNMIWGSQHEPPQALPETATYEWAGDVVDQAFAEAVADVNGVPGGTFFIEQWLKLDDSTIPLEGDYEAQLARSSNLVLEVLLRTTWAPDRVGVFSEKAWLARHESIPSRGADISGAVFSRMIPAPPQGVNRNILDPELPDRTAMEAAVSSQVVCTACHNIMNPLGYALGHFDRAGDFRELDHDLPIDTTGSTMLSGDVTLEFDGIADLGEKASNTCDANLAIVDSFMRVALSSLGYDETFREGAIEANRERVARAYFAGGRSYAALVKAFAQSDLVLR